MPEKPIMVYVPVHSKPPIGRSRQPVLQGVEMLIKTEQEMVKTEFRGCCA